MASRPESQKILYIANIRLPTEKAHGLQIMQNCEAFAASRGRELQVELWTPRRVNTSTMRAIPDVFAHYNVAPCFQIRRLPCIDLMPLGNRIGKWIERIAFPLQSATFMLIAVLYLVFLRLKGVPIRAVYSRDPWLIILARAVLPSRLLIYEAHQLSRSRIGAWAQSRCVHAAGLTIAVTGRLRDELVQRGARHAITEHDGYSPGRFADLPTRDEARRLFGSLRDLPPDRVIVGYVGQLHTMGMGKGVDLLIEGAARLGDPRLVVCLVGGPAAIADQLRDQWTARGLRPENLITVGQVPPKDVPRYIASFDVAAMTFPFTEHFAYYASPLKLFEYMAVGRAILATDLPAIREVVTHNESAYLVPAGDIDAIAEGLAALIADPGMRDRLAESARQYAEYYTWTHRAERILAAHAHPTGVR